MGRKPVCLILAIVHKLFQLERSIAVGIQPIKAIKKKIPESFHKSRGKKFSFCSTGPLIKAKTNAVIVEIIRTNPIILIMDEATAFMDPSTEATLQKDLERILNKRTALVIAHRLATIEKSDKILVLKGGALIEEGNHRELRLKKGLYFQLSELQEKGFASF